MAAMTAIWLKLPAFKYVYGEKKSEVNHAWMIWDGFAMLHMA